MGSRASSCQVVILKDTVLLVEGRRRSNLLPTEAKIYFDSLSSSASADAWEELSRRQDEFERHEYARGGRPDGFGFSAGLALLYKDTLSTHALTLVDALKNVHQSFECPLDEAVDTQLDDWGARALAAFYQGLEGGYTRHLQRYGIQPALARGLDQAYVLARTTVANLPRRYLWELRNVPSKRPQKSATTAPVHVTVQNNGTIGAVQTGAASVANVQQQSIGTDMSDLRAALATLKDALQRAQDIDPEVRGEVLADLDNVHAELQEQNPRKGKLLRWLGGVGTVVGTIGSVQPAYEAVRSVARALGLPL